jgi:hypothetical protein
MLTFFGQQTAFTQNFTGHGKRVVGRWHTAVDCGHHDDFLDVFGREARIGRPIECGAHMHCKLFIRAHGNHHRQHHQTPRLVAQGGAAPDVVPGVARNQVLKFGVKGIGVGLRLVHPGVAQHAAAVDHAFVKIIHNSPSVLSVL